MKQSMSLPRRVAIASLVFGYFGIITFWLNPTGYLQSNIMPVVFPIIQAFGIGQSWSVFSPDVREANYHETALIAYDDGLLKLYEFPRMQKLGYLERFRCEKFRKVFFDCMPWPDHQQFLPDFAKYVALANSSSVHPTNTVALIHHSCRTPSPDAVPWVNRADLPEHTTISNYYFYNLQEAKSK